MLLASPGLLEFEPADVLLIPPFGLPLPLHPVARFPVRFANGSSYEGENLFGEEWGNTGARRFLVICLKAATVVVIPQDQTTHSLLSKEMHSVMYCSMRYEVLATSSMRVACVGETTK